MPYFKLLLLFVCSALFSVQSLSKIVNIDILIEDGYFPLIINANKQQGLAFEFVQILNESQHEFNFSLNPLPSKRLIRTVEAKKFDALFLMALIWLPKSTHTYLTKTKFSVTVANELYALKDNALDQSYFDNLDRLTKAGVLGYAYKFADYNTDEMFLSHVHNMSLTRSEIHVAKMVLFKRADIGIIGNLTSQYFKHTSTNTIDMDLLYKRKTPDQIYDTAFLVNQQSSRITASLFDDILKLPTVKSKLKDLFNRYGITSSVKPW
ncbi:hypothetical protein [Colwellia piezophila]|uniref:hypothetical protein n=1 Tax=Colwellia piezophila TaxID=211668 RepID=UPI0003817AF3|nr:hypothetical protein [Colwellia piezophila]